MSLYATIEGVCRMLREATNQRVMLDRPDEAVPGTYVWPWCLDDLPALVNESPARGQRPTPGFVIRFLVVVTPALRDDGLQKLDAVRQAIHEHPLVPAGGHQARVIPESLSAEERTRLFTAAGLPLSICFAGIVQSESRT